MADMLSAIFYYFVKKGMDNNIPIVHIFNFLTINQKNTVGILAYDTVCEVVIGTGYSTVDMSVA